MYRQNYKIQIYKPSSKIPSPLVAPSSFSICFQKEPNVDPLFKLKEWCKEIVLIGAEVFKEPMLESFGAEAWMRDPEGNTFLLFVPLLRSVD